MTPKEAIDFINNEVQIDVRLCTEEKVDRTIEVFNLATKALEKQIPKKVLPYNKFERHCECGAIVKSYCKYCYDCGQALDWSGEK